MNPVSPDHDGKTGRAADGRFQAGHAGLGGRPKNADQIKISERTWRCGEKTASVGKIDRLWEMAFKIALAGDAGMFKYLLDRCGGSTAPWLLVDEARELREMADRSSE
jgi:hypothetical protein